MHETDRLYVEGGWRPTVLGAPPIEVENPATGECIGAVAAGGEADVDAAVAAAVRAFPSWAGSDPAVRAKSLQRLRETLGERADDLAGTVTAELGAPVRIARKVHVGLPLAVLDSYLGVLPDLVLSERAGSSLVLREPVGVVGAITPWNYPLHQVVAKVAAALAVGCTVVLKPSELTPLTALALARAVHDAGFPPGVFNLVTGTGPVAGEALVRHPDVDMISFTGSTQVGRRIGALAAATVKRTSLELGGKSANVILPDADLERAVAAGVSGVMLNTGQSCNAWTRMLVSADQYDEAVGLAVQAAAAYRPADPRSPDSRLGPLASAAQLERVRGFIRAGVAEGAELVAGGPERPADLAVGHYVLPTVFAGVQPGMSIAQEEIFGPVLSVLRYRDEDEAVAIANGTPYGLSGAVWSRDEERAVAFARRMRTGQVDVNGGRFNPLAPFGGVRQSGHGRELGRAGIEEFTVHKALQL
ncbi:aldehyde dehydrogenase family protein [Kitasatospora griseola]|uniref:aldehyde dehydrogenase family protein n=1 Tax=Kitasatospora griseola TaxID=2064 RepID=UPI0037FFC42E